MSEQSKIEFARASAMTDRMRSYQVWVDGEKIGTIKNGTTESFDVSPGRHEVKLTIDWTESPTLTADVPKGGTVHLTCRPRPNPFTAWWYALFAREKYLRLDLAS